MKSSKILWPLTASNIVRCYFLIQSSEQFTSVVLDGLSDHLPCHLILHAFFSQKDCKELNNTMPITEKYFWQFVPADKRNSECLFIFCVSVAPCRIYSMDGVVVSSFYRHFLLHSIQFLDDNKRANETKTQLTTVALKRTDIIWTLRNRKGKTFSLAKCLCSHIAHSTHIIAARKTLSIHQPMSIV